MMKIKITGTQGSSAKELEAYVHELNTYRGRYMITIKIIGNFTD